MWRKFSLTSAEQNHLSVLFVLKTPDILNCLMILKISIELSLDANMSSAIPLSVYFIRINPVITPSSNHFVRYGINENISLKIV